MQADMLTPQCAEGEGQYLWVLAFVFDMRESAVQVPAGALSPEAQEAAAAAAYPDAAGPPSPGQPPAAQAPWQRQQQQQQAQAQPPQTAHNMSTVSNPAGSRAAGLSISLPPEDYVSVQPHPRHNMIDQQGQTCVHMAA